MLALCPLAGAAEILLVHLPSAPLESSTQLATAVETLGEYLSAEVSGLELEVKIFRRWEDAHAFFTENASAITALLSDASFLLDLPPNERLIPVWRFVRSGKETYHRLLDVRTESQIQGVAELKARTLHIVKTTGGETLAFLEQAVFGGELAPQEWFGRLSAVADDFTAVASVLHSQGEVALIAEHNPLLRSHLGGELQSVYRSPPLSLPVLALRVAALRPEQRSALDDALARISQVSAGQQILAKLGLDGFRPILRGSSPFDRDALLRLPSSRRKVMEIALPSGSAVSAQLPPPLGPEDVTFSLAIELPEFPTVTTLPTEKNEPHR